jgi:hypothetical protein
VTLSVDNGATARLFLAVYTDTAICGTVDKAQSRSPGWSNKDGTQAGTGFSTRDFQEEVLDWLARQRERPLAVFLQRIEFVAQYIDPSRSVVRQTRQAQLPPAVCQEMVSK